jgi:cysteinyl-tRNA synthetase
VRDVMEGKATAGRPVDPAVLRYELLKAHYRSNMNFTTKGLEDSASAVRKLRDTAAQLEKASSPEMIARAEVPGEEHPMVHQFKQALADDLNMSGALGGVFKWLGEHHQQPAESLLALRKIDSVLNVLKPSASGASGGGGGGDDEAAAKCKAIDAARAGKDFATADRLRKELQDAGYEVMNSKAGTTARKKLA